MSYRGDIALGNTIDIKFTTRRFSTGAPFTLAGSPVISAYVGNSVTQITAGITLTVDFDGVTGLHNVRVVATSGNGFAAQTDVDLVITTGTVDSISVVGEVIGSFSIENRAALRPTVAGRTLDVTATGAGGVDWANVEGPTTTVTLTNTTINSTQKVDVETIKTNSVVNAGTVTFPTNATLASTTNITAGTVTTATNVTTVNGLAANVITAASMAADASAEIADQVWDEALAGHLGAGSTGLALNSAGAAGDPWSTAVPGAYGAGTAGSRIGRIPDIAAGGAGGLFIAGTNAATAVTTALTANITGNVSGSVGSVAANGITAASLATDAGAEIADAVWDEAIAGHLTAGTTGLALNSAGSAGDPWSTAVPGAYGAGTAGSKLGRMPDVAAGASGGLFIAGSNAATTVNITGNLSGSVGSVTGAVSSVTTGVTVTTNNDKTGYALTSGERNSVADALLDRNMATGTDSGSPTVRTVRQALRFLRNKWSIAGTTLSVCKEDDATASWTATVTTDAGGAPVVGNDPTGP